MTPPRTAIESSYEARYWHLREDGRLACDLCPRDCLLADGQRGLCFVRKREGDRMVLGTYGRSSGFCLDPIEKKPLHHFYPGSSVLSFGTAGCNLSCKFCQNWDMSKAKDTDVLSEEASPLEIALAARAAGARSVAFTYNDPTIFAEYAIDVAKSCHRLGVRTVAVTAGYIHPAPRAELYAHIDAANVDLKAFTEHFYHSLTAASLAPVLDTLRWLVHETRVWTEVTTLLIPGHNDGDDEIRQLSRFVANELGRHVPLHFSAFHPDYRMLDVPPTSLATLRRARDLALEAGLFYVYTGNVHDPEGGTTYCPSCHRPAIEREGYRISRYALDEAGACSACGARIDGHFASHADRFGSRRLPVQVGVPHPPR